MEIEFKKDEIGRFESIIEDKSGNEINLYIKKDLEKTSYEFFNQKIYNRNL